MKPLPEFSPAMLRLFLHARCRAAHAERPARCGYGVSARLEKDRLRRLAGVTDNDMHMAWMGRLPTPEKRVRIWAVLGHFPTDFGIMLTHGGQENG